MLLDFVSCIAAATESSFHKSSGARSTHGKFCVHCILLPSLLVSQAGILLIGDLSDVTLVSHIIHFCITQQAVVRIQVPHFIVFLRVPHDIQRLFSCKHFAFDLHFQVFEQGRLPPFRLLQQSKVLIG